jgi:hypothetical protein
MTGPTPFSLTKLFTTLLGRKVAFAQAVDSPSKDKQVYGVYTVFPGQSAVVVKADLALLGSFAGVLVGLPDAAVKTQLKTTPIEEILRDAIYEVLNIASEEMTTHGRASFSRMEMDQVYLNEDALNALRKPAVKNFFNVTVDGYQGGRFSVYAQTRGDY